MSCAQIAVCRCAQIAVCVAHRFRKMAVSSIWKRNQREVCFGSFPEAGFFCYTELLKSILPPFPTLRAFGHCDPPGVWTLRPSGRLDIATLRAFEHCGIFGCFANT